DLLESVPEHGPTFFDRGAPHFEVMAEPVGLCAQALGLVPAIACLGRRGRGGLDTGPQRSELFGLRGGFGFQRPRAPARRRPPLRARRALPLAIAPQAGGFRGELFELLATRPFAFGRDELGAPGRGERLPCLLDGCLRLVARRRRRGRGLFGFGE